MHKQRTPVSIINPVAASDLSRSREVVAEAQFTPEVILAPWSHLKFNDKRWLASENFVATSYLVYDFDDGVPTMQQVVQQLSLLNYKHVIGPSKSHQKAKISGKTVKPAVDRFRVVLFLDEAVTSVQAYKQLYTQVAASFEWTNFDKQTIDVARFWSACTEVTSVNDTGVDVRVADYEIKETTSTLLGRGLKAALTEAASGAKAKGRLSERTRKFLIEGAPDGGWHAEFVAAAMDLKMQGYSQAEASLQLSKASPELLLDDNDLKQLEDVYLRRDPFHTEKINWPKMVNTNSGAQPDKQASVNFIKAVTELMPGAPFKYYKNVINNKLFINSKEGKELDDAHVNAAYAFCAEAGLAKDVKLIENAITQAAETYHPVKDFAEAKKWDGLDRIPELFKTIKLDASVTEEQANFYQEVYLRRWLYAAIHRVYRADIENGVLVFMGPQGAGKSRWFKKIATSIWSNGFSDALIDPKNKDHQAYLVDSFMHHIAELDATTSQKHAGELKDYLNKQTVTFRRPYARLTETRDTMCSFCATVNPATFLQDSTGSRRFMVIPVESVNPDHDVDMQQVAAQAYEEAVVKGYRTWMNKEEIAKINSFNTEFQFEDDYEGLVKSYVMPGEDRMTTREILETLHIETHFLTKTQKEKINSILKMNKVKTVNHRNRQMWCVDRRELMKKVSGREINSLASKKLLGYDNSEDNIKQ